jgi:hypothetical protein
MDYSYNPNMKQAPLSLFTAYMPGRFTGVGDDGVSVNPFTRDSETMRRNFYSTKFVQLNSLTDSGGWTESSQGFQIYSEGGINNAGNFNRSQKLYRNPLDAQNFGIDINAIKY